MHRYAPTENAKGMTGMLFPVVEKVANACIAYTLFTLEVCDGYGKWIQESATNECDLLILALLPALVVGGALWLLPGQLGRAIAVTLLVPHLVTSAALMFRR
jgi:hypothetical protein